MKCVFQVGDGKDRKRSFLVEYINPGLFVDFVNLSEEELKRGCGMWGYTKIVVEGETNDKDGKYFNLEEYY